MPLLLGELQHGQGEEVDELLHRVQQDLRPRHRRLDIEDKAGMAVEGQVAGPHHVAELLTGAQLVEEGGGHDVVGQGEAGEIPRPGGA